MITGLNHSQLAVPIPNEWVNQLGVLTADAQP